MKMGRYVLEFFGNDNVQRELLSTQSEHGTFMNSKWARTCVRERKKQDGMWEMDGSRTIISKTNDRCWGERLCLVSVYLGHNEITQLGRLTTAES